MLIFVTIFICIKKYFISSNMHYCGILLLPATTRASTRICGVLLLPATIRANTKRSSLPLLSDSSTLAAILILASL